MCSQRNVDYGQNLISSRLSVGGRLEDTQIVYGVVIDKDFSHPQMAKEIKDARICILTCPFEPPKLKTSTDFVVKNVEDYNRVAALEQSYFVDMVKRVKVRESKKRRKKKIALLTMLLVLSSRTRERIW